MLTANSTIEQNLRIQKEKAKVRALTGPKRLYEGFIISCVGFYNNNNNYVCCHCGVVMFIEIHYKRLARDTVDINLGNDNNIHTAQKQ